MWYKPCRKERIPGWCSRRCGTNLIEGNVSRVDVAGDVVHHHREAEKHQERETVDDFSFHKRMSNFYKVRCALHTCVISRWWNKNQWWIQDIPEVGAWILGGGGVCEHTILPKFPPNCIKSKEFGCLGGGGGRASPMAPLDPPIKTVRIQLIKLRLSFCALFYLFM